MPKIVRFHEFGDASVLKVEDVPLQEPNPGEVRIEVEAIGLNHGEVMFRQGQQLVKPKFPSPIGYDAAGRIDAVGEGVSGFKQGDRVNTFPGFKLDEYGVYGEYAIVPAHSVTHYPDNITPEQATTAGVQYHTAYYALFEVGKVQPGDYFLTTAATGSIGLAAIEMGKEIGATVIATTRTSSKKPILLERGADYAIATGEEDMVARLNDITRGHGVDVAFDPIGGATVGQIARAAAPSARIILYGLIDRSPIVLNPLQFMSKHYTITAYSAFQFTGGTHEPRNHGAVARARRYIYDRLADGALKGETDSKKFELDNISEAHLYMESNRHIGKVIVIP